MKVPVLAVVLALGMCLRVHAVDRWTALSQIESGDNDLAIGPCGEVSRYQIRPDIWRHYAAEKADWQKPADSLSVARAIMQDRCATFEDSFHRSPTDFEFYVLWNAPAQIQKPSKIVSQRAERFCNVIASR